MSAVVCTSCHAVLDDTNTPSPYSTRLLRARKNGFDKPLCFDCLKKLDHSELPDAVAVAEDFMENLCLNILDLDGIVGYPRETVVEAVRLFAERLTREPQAAFAMADEPSEEEDDDDKP